MTVAALISGAIYEAPEEKISSTGKSYVRVTVRAAEGEHERGDFWSCLAFGDTAKAEILRLKAGERLALQGKMRLEIYERDGKTRISRTLFVDHVLALRVPPREKRPKERAASPADQLPLQQAAPMPRANSFYSDEIPF